MILKYLFNQRGEVIPGDGGAPAPAPAGGPWYSSLPAELQNDPTIKATPDVATLAKRFVDTNKEFGSRIKLPGKDAKPEEISQLKAKLYESGVFKAPPATPGDYKITRPETMPESAWSSELEGKFRELAHKHGLSDETVQELMALNHEQFGGAVKAYEVDRAEAMKFIDTYAQNLKVDKAELIATGDRFLTQVFKDNPAGLEKIKQIMAPETIAAFGHAGLLMQESSGVTGEEFVSPTSNAEQEATDIIKNKDNPKYKLFHSGDTATVNYVNSLWQKAYPGEVTL